MVSPLGWGALGAAAVCLAGLAWVVLKLRDAAEPAEPVADPAKAPTEGEA